MDHATLTDNSGRKADFRNTVVILTSNAGSREMGAAAIGFADKMAGLDDESRGKVAAGKAKTALERVFSPEFRNRLDAIVTFKALSRDAMETIVDKFILQLESQLTDRKVAIALTPAARVWLATAGYDRCLRRASAGACHPEGSARRADRSDPLRCTRTRRHGHDRPGGRPIDLCVRGPRLSANRERRIAKGKLLNRRSGASLLTPARPGERHSGTRGCVPAGSRRPEWALAAAGSLSSRLAARASSFCDIRSTRAA
jgi:hypothetical protein